MNKMQRYLISLLLALCLTSTAIPTTLPIGTVVTVNAKTYNKETVANVQKKLKNLGYNCGTADGVAGKKTKSAIKSYQKSKGLKATGTVNKSLLDSLGVKEVKSSSSSSSSSKSTYTVYITRTGAKYHRGSCRYLSRSKIPISLSDAKSYYDPCSVCRP